MKLNYLFSFVDLIKKSILIKKNLIPFKLDPNPPPKVFYFCNKIIDEASKKNAEKWLKLNPDYTFVMHDNNLCEKFLEKEFGEKHVTIFKFLKDGPIKADFWRLCVLYNNGGIYSDIDNEPLVPIKDFIEPNVDLVTCSAYMKKMNFNPNFIIAKKGCSILKGCIEWYIQKFDQKKTYTYWGWSVMKAFTDVLKIPKFKRKEGIYEYRGLKIQILAEVPGKHHFDAHNLYKNVRIFNNRTLNWDANSHSFR
jgi:hypothetical protein